MLSCIYATRKDKRRIKKQIKRNTKEKERRKRRNAKMDFWAGFGKIISVEIGNLKICLPQEISFLIQDAKYEKYGVFVMRVMIRQPDEEKTSQMRFLMAFLAKWLFVKILSLKFAFLRGQICGI